MSVFICKDCDRLVDSDFSPCVDCSKCDALLCERCEPEPVEGRPVLCRACDIAESRSRLHRDVIAPFAQMRGRS